LKLQFPIYTIKCSFLLRSIQSNEVSSSDERYSARPPRHFHTRELIMEPYVQLPHNCYARIIEATFDSDGGKLEIKYGYDHFSHAYDPKAFQIDGYYIATYCLQSEREILVQAFNSEPFLRWKRSQLEEQQN